MPSTGVTTLLITQCALFGISYFSHKREHQLEVAFAPIEGTQHLRNLRCSTFCFIYQGFRECKCIEGKKRGTTAL